IWQAHTKALPRHGDVMVYFGNWYADLLYNVMRMATLDDDDNEDDDDKVKKNEYKNNKTLKNNALPIGQWQDYLKQELTKLQAFEQDLAANQTKLLKCW